MAEDADPVGNPQLAAQQLVLINRIAAKVHLPFSVWNQTMMKMIVPQMALLCPAETFRIVKMTHVRPALRQRAHATRQYQITEIPAIESC